MEEWDGNEDSDTVMTEVDDAVKFGTLDEPVVIGDLGNEHIVIADDTAAVLDDVKESFIVKETATTSDPDNDRLVVVGDQPEGSAVDEKQEGLTVKLVEHIDDDISL